MKVADRKRVRGATKEKVNPSKIKFFPWKTLLVLTISVMAIFVGLQHIKVDKLHTMLSQKMERPVNNIVVNGELNYLARPAMQELVIAELNHDFVNIDITAMQLALEENPWIDSASVRRVWPDTLRLDIQEQRPIAKWSNSGFINAKGEIIRTNHVDLLDGLPEFTGREDMSEEIAEWYIKTTELFDRFGLQITGIEIDDKNEWVLNLNNTFKLYLGSDHIQKKLDNFQYIYENKLAAEQDIIESVDMRYKNALAVSWSKNRNQLIVANGQ